MLNENELKAFKQMLHEGKVEFDFVKVSGETRHAIGTLNSNIIPHTARMITFKCTNIDWIIDGFDKKLPFELKIKLDGCFDKASDAAISTALSAEIKKLYDVEIRSFDFERLEARKMSTDSVFFFDCEKNAYRSCKSANIISYSKIN